MSTNVIITSAARKGLEKAARHVQDKLLNWVESVRLFGVLPVRKVTGYHDEALKGARKHERSIRLNKQWRAIYSESENNTITIIILEVTAHDYRKK